MRGVPQQSPNPFSYAGHYDTGDFANIELIKRGYRIAIAPPEIREHFATFKGVSSGLLRVQKEPVEGYRNLTKNPAPLFGSCVVAKELGRFLTELEGSRQQVVRADLLDRAYHELRPLVGDAQASEIEENVHQQIELLRAAIPGLTSVNASLQTMGVHTRAGS